MCSCNCKQVYVVTGVCQNPAISIGDCDGVLCANDSWWLCCVTVWFLVDAFTLYAGKVIKSFDCNIIIPKCGNWFQTNPLEHESSDHADSTVSSGCVTNGKDMALQRHIWSTFVTLLWFHITWILVLNESLVSYYFQNLLTILAQFFKYTFESSYNCFPMEITWRKMVHSACLIPFSINSNATHIHNDVSLYQRILLSYYFSSFSKVCGLYGFECKYVKKTEMGHLS